MAILFGGSTRPGFLSDAVLQALSVPLVILAARSLPALLTQKSTRGVVGLALFALAMCFLQVLSLPPEIWTRLPGRAVVQQSFEAATPQLPWMPVSINLAATWLSLLALIAPVGIFLSTLRLSASEQQALTLVLLAVGALNVLLGLLQVAQGPGSQLHFFDVTFGHEAVGFFANRNHFAAFNNCLIIFCVAWMLRVFELQDGARPIHHQPCSKASTKNFSAGVLLLLLVAFIAAQAMARSRTGLVLTIVALFGSWALVALLPNRNSVGRIVKIALVVAGVALTLILQFGLYRILLRFSSDPLADARIFIFKNTWQVAKGLLPVGAGIGSFVRGYATAEPVNDILSANVYINHAHNDILEYLLENGLVGLSLLAIFSIWFAVRCTQLWLQARSNAEYSSDIFAGASAMVILLLIGHSLTDYPLRTTALLSVFAFACGILVRTPQEKCPDTKRPQPTPDNRETPKPHHRSPIAAPRNSPLPTDAFEWPDEWKGNP